jgi:hypothetical protein
MASPVGNFKAFLKILVGGYVYFSRKNWLVGKDPLAILLLERLG